MQNLELRLTFGLSEVENLWHARLLLFVLIAGSFEYQLIEMRLRPIVVKSLIGSCSFYLNKAHVIR